MRAGEGRLVTVVRQADSLDEARGQSLAGVLVEDPTIPQADLSDASRVVAEHRLGLVRLHPLERPVH